MWSLETIKRINDKASDRTYTQAMVECGIVVPTPEGADARVRVAEEPKLEKVGA